MFPLGAHQVSASENRLGKFRLPQSPSQQIFWNALLLFVAIIASWCCMRSKADLLAISQSHPGPNRRPGRFNRPTYNQAAKIIAKFGGESKFAAAIGISRPQAYKWNYERPYGCDGLVPGSKVSVVKAAARREGIVLTDCDWAPERISYEAEG